MPKPTTISMDARTWDIKYSINLPSHPTQDGSSWFIDIHKDTDELDYVLGANTASVLNKSLSMDLEIIAAPDVVFDYKTEPENTCIFPAHTRFIIYKSMLGEFGRWWSNPKGIELKPGIFNLTVPVVPAEWSSVYGKFGNEAVTNFEKTVSTPTALGLTFGGGCFFSHGVRARGGDIRIKLNNFKII